MNNQTETGTDLTIPAEATIKAAFAIPADIDKILTTIEIEANSYVLDVSTAKSRKEITRLGMQVVRSKTLMDGIGKDINDPKRAEIKIVDEQRRIVRDRLDTLALTIRAPLKQYEAAEKNRLEQIHANIDALETKLTAFSTAAQIGEEINSLEAAKPTKADFEEYLEHAQAAIAASLETLAAHLSVAKQRESDAKELEELRDFKRQKAEKEATELAASQKAARDKAAEQERAEAADRAKVKAEAEAAEKTKQATRAAKEQAEALAQKVIDDAAEVEAKHKRELQAAKDREEQAATDERTRIETKRADDKRKAERRATNKKAQDKVRSDIANSLAKIAKADIPQALIDGLVAHCSVKF
ncbi:MAG: hypothetical protein L3J33_03310 [Rhodobacteraceae bacterium]|nr:hypothetical protein [Paracoccaceae bacterium]